MTHHTDHEDRIRQRAHEIWLAEGQPSGREKEHWEQAETEVQETSAEPGLDRPGSIGGDEIQSGVEARSVRANDARARR